MKAKISILVLMLVLSLCSSVLASDEVVYMSDGDDDLFLTETGHLFQGTPLIEINEPLIGIMAFFRFQDIDVPKDSIINSATLHLWTNNDFDPFDLLWATIYGIDEDDCEAFGDTSDLNSRPVTTAYVNWNISGVVGQVTEHTVEVTDIIREITERFNWVSGNDIGFKIVSAKGGPQRQVSAFEYSAMPEAYLNVTYGEAPPQTPQDQANPPYDDPEQYNWTYWYSYRGYDIWNVTETGWVDYCTFTKIGSQPGRITVVNCTYVDSYYLWEPDDNCSLYKDYVDNAGVAVKFKVTWHTFWDTSGVAERYFLTLYGMTTNLGPQFVGSGDNICLVTWSDLTQHMLRYQVYVYDGTSGYLSWIPGTITSFPTTHWISFGYNESTQRFYATVYTDEWETQWGQVNGIGGWDPLSLNYQYGANWYGPYAQKDQGHWSLYGKADLDQVFFIHAPTCNLTDPDPYDPEEDDPEEIIDDILGPDPEDPEPPVEEWETSPISRFRLRLYFLITGWSMIIGPLLFFSWRRPTGSQVVYGVLIMLIGAGFLIQITQI